MLYSVLGRDSQAILETDDYEMAVIAATCLAQVMGSVAHVRLNKERVIADPKYPFTQVAGLLLLTALPQRQDVLAFVVHAVPGASWAQGSVEFNLPAEGVSIAYD